MRGYRMQHLVLASLFLLGAAARSEAGFVDFFGDFSSMSMVNVPNTIAAGQVVDVNFGGTSTNGLSTVSGVVEFSNNASGTAGSISLKNVVFQLISGSSATGGPPPSFGIGAITNFAYLGSSPITGTNSAAGNFTFTGPNQIATMASGGSVGGVTIPNQSPGLISNSSGPYPQVSPFGPPVNSVAGISATPSVQINYSLSTSLGITRSGGTTGAGPTTTFSAATLGYSAAVPEPASLVMTAMGLGVAFVIARSRTRPAR